MTSGVRSASFANILAVVACTTAATIACANGASATQYQVIKSFCEANSCLDGKNPQAGLIRDAAGNLYGTAVLGGANGNGVVFELKLNKATQQYQYRILHNFCAKPNCTDGTRPQTAVIMDTNRNLYGTTEEGGSSNDGIIYVLQRNQNYALRVLHNFCAAPGCADGSIPDTGLTYQGQQSGALYDGVGRLYGTTVHTDSRGDGAGVAYELIPGHGPLPHRYRVLHSFCLADCLDGTFPSNLTIDAHGQLYGVTEQGGKNNHGTLFEIFPRRAQLKVLYDFCSRAACADGAEPDLHQTLAMDSGGNFYGTTIGGGAHEGGIVWEFLRRGARGTKEIVLHNFCAQTGCADGKAPRQGVLLGPNDEVYGTAVRGGNSCPLSSDGCGVIFELQDRSYAVLYSFCPTGGSCLDGATPFGDHLIRDPSGTLYGTTTSGGDSGAALAGGTVFSLTPCRGVALTGAWHAV